MNPTNDNFWLYIFAIIGSLIVAIIIARAIFSIPKRVKQNRAQIRLLSLIAKKLNAEPMQVEEIIKEAEGSDYKPIDSK